MILFGKDKNTKTDECFDDILLRAKFYIYKCRINKIVPNIQIFVNYELKTFYKIDKYVHYLEMNTEKFYRKWLLYADLVNWVVKKRMYNFGPRLNVHEVCLKLYLSRIVSILFLSRSMWDSVRELKCDNWYT